MDLRDLGDAQLWQLKEDLQQEVAHRELNAPPEAHPWATGGLWQGVGTPMWMTRRSPFQEGGDGDPENSHHSLPAPLNRGGHWTFYQYPSHWSATGYSKNKYFQQWCHTRKDRSVLWTVVPQGTMYQGPIPRISSLGKYCQVIERDSGRHGPVHGSYN